MNDSGQPELFGQSPAALLSFGLVIFICLRAFGLRGLAQRRLIRAPFGFFFFCLLLPRCAVAQLRLQFSRERGGVSMGDT